MTGRRIVDILYFNNQIQKVHDGGFDCSFINMDYQSEKIIALHSILTYQCKMCKIKTKIYTENPKTETFPINKAAVHGCQAVGIGQTQLSELMAFLEIPTLSESSYL